MMSRQMDETLTFFCVAPCSSHVPGYIASYKDFVAKGVSDIYIVAVNDIVSTLSAHVKGCWLVLTAA